MCVVIVDANANQSNVSINMTQSKQLPTDFLRNLLKNILKKEGLDTTKVYDVTSGVNGNQQNCLTSVYRVVVYPDNNDITKRNSLFLKCMPVSSARSEAFHTTTFFKNEVIIYDQVLPALLDFQRQSKVKTPFSGTPKCYKSLSDGENEVLVMEDLQSRGYIMLNRRQGMNVEEIRVMFEELGRFHALSLAMKDKKLIEFTKAKSELTEVLFTDLQKNVFGQFFEASSNDALELVKARYSDESVYVDKMKMFSDKVYATMTKLATPDPEDEKYNIITHGDLWINNFLFRYNDSGSSEKVDKMSFLNFQVSRYACLALDLSCAIFLTMDRETRDTNRDTLLKSYHDSLRLLLEELGSDPLTILPFEVLEKLLQKYSRFGVGMACLNLPMQLYEEGSDDNLDLLEGGSEGVIEAVLAALKRKTEKCKERIIDVITEAVERGYLD